MNAPYTRIRIKNEYTRSRIKDQARPADQALGLRPEPLMRFGPAGDDPSRKIRGLGSPPPKQALAPPARRRPSSREGDGRLRTKQAGTGKPSCGRLPLVDEMAIMDRIGSGAIAMKTMSARDAKNAFGMLIDTARAEPVMVEKHGRPVVVVISIEEFERLNKTANREQRDDVRATRRK